MARGKGVDGPHPVDRYVGRRVCEKRISLGYNQSDLGRALGLTFQQIQKYETGANRVSAGRLYLLADRLNISPGWFFEGLADIDAQSGDELDASSRFAIECVRSLTRIRDEKVRASILNMVRALADSEMTGEAKPNGHSDHARPRAD